MTSAVAVAVAVMNRAAIAAMTVVDMGAEDKVVVVVVEATTARVAARAAARIAAHVAAPGPLHHAASAALVLPGGALTIALRVAALQCTRRRCAMGAALHLGILTPRARRPEAETVVAARLAAGGVTRAQCADPILHVLTMTGVIGMTTLLFAS
jgi:hypothetical protein